MSAIITDKIRILNAKNFVSGVQSTSTNSYYAWIGLPDATSYQSDWDTDPPSPKDNLDQSNDYWDTMIALKKITSSDVRQVVQKRLWSSGTTYDMYRGDYTRSNTAAVSGVHGSFLKPSLEAMGITEDQWKKSKKIDFGSELDAAKAEAQAWKTIWSAGQGVTSIKDSPSISELVPLLKEEFIYALDKQKKIPQILKLMQFPCSDALSYSHLAEGRVDVVIQCSNKIWDIHPLIPIIKAAGGYISTWDNRDAINAGNILVSSNKTIHNKFLKLLKPVSK